ncbi:hypothetical protein BBJ28_00018613 [Nothophytophthora sp. Chile5]|nr:hypothetical protein BBJ28_00018613 [Nothophytophthora sp. Chile5]
MTVDGAPPPPLPAGWLVRVSRSKGKIYYYNTRTKATQWTRPSAESVEPADERQEEGGVPKRRRLEEANHEAAKPEDPSPEANESSILHSLIATSMRVGGSSTTRGLKRSVAFSPWPHQLAAVEQVISAIQTSSCAPLAEEGGSASPMVEKFLLQHSTGAGKTLTIAALAHQLLYVKDARGTQFHTVVIMLDRVKLNEQVGDEVERYLQRNGVDEVFRAESIEHLAKLLDASTQQQQSPQRVIITTTHKMGLLVRDDVLLTRLLHRSTKMQHDETGEAEGDDVFQRVAIITDEAHRSHTTSTRDAIEKVMKAGEGSRAQLTVLVSLCFAAFTLAYACLSVLVNERLIWLCASDLRLQFVGFTATPNSDALDLFGSLTRGRFLCPFHCYPIAEATADGRIMHALENYTCVRCKVETSVFPKQVQELLRETRGARRRLLDHASDDIAVLKAKALIMMTDFQGMKREHPKVKCMVVARSRLDVVRYYTLITTFVAKRMLGWNCYAAFSGSVTVEAKTGDADESIRTVTEQTLNSRHVPLAISDIVVVCDKLDTGYNEPLLACMYIDRFLRSSSHTVQLLSRLNRRHKSKPCVRIMDFANHAAQVRRDFADYWQAAKMLSVPDSIDEVAEQMDLVTAISILCDYFPELCSTPVDIKDPRAFVSEHVLPLERDAFQQVVGALRGGVAAGKKLELAGNVDAFDTLSPFR